MGRNTGRGKVAYSWISPDPAKAGPTLEVVVVVSILDTVCILHSSKWRIIFLMAIPYYFSSRTSCRKLKMVFPPWYLCFRILCVWFNSSLHPYN